MECRLHERGRSMPSPQHAIDHTGARTEVLPLLLPLDRLATAPAGLRRVRPRTLPPLSPLAWLFAACSVLLHLPGINQYGFFRDELYYIACGNHLAFGYIDQPPLIALVARLSSIFAGTSPAGFRVFPVLAGAALVLLT